MQKVLGIVFAFLFIGVTCAQKEKEKMSRDVENMIRKGMAYLQRKANEAPAEERPLIMLALVKCHKALDPEGKISDPAIKKIAAEIVGMLLMACISRRATLVADDMRPESPPWHLELMVARNIPAKSTRSPNGFWTISSVMVLGTIPVEPRTKAITA